MSGSNLALLALTFILFLERVVRMIKLLFKIMTAFWILSPAMFAIMRSIGIFNYSQDWLIFLFLSFMSTAAMFLSWKR